MVTFTPSRFQFHVLTYDFMPPKKLHSFIAWKETKKTPTLDLPSLQLFCCFCIQKITWTLIDFTNPLVLHKHVRDTPLSP